VGCASEVGAGIADAAADAGADIADAAADAGADMADGTADTGVDIDDTPDAEADTVKDAAGTGAVDAGVAVAGRWFFLSRVARFPDFFAATDFFLAPVARLAGIKIKKEGREVKTNSTPMPNFIPSTPGTGSSSGLHLRAITKKKKGATTAK
jgi:hypothetical protein